MRKIAACFLFVFSIFALAEPKGIKETIRLLNGSNQVQEEEEEEKKTEMKEPDPLSAGEFCCDRNQKGGDAHSWSPQQVASFVAGETLLSPSDTPSDSKDSQSQ